jgi:hypothetical protein
LLSAFASAALVVYCALVTSVHAQPLPRPALHWSRAADATSCIDPQQLALRVTALTGPVLVAASAADVSIEGHVERLPSGSFRARVTSTSRGGAQRGERTLEQDGDCRALDEALAFVIALLIDPDLVLQELPAGLIGLGAEGQAPEAVLLRELDATPPVPAAAMRAAVRAEAAPPVRAKAAPARPDFRIALGPLVSLRELPRLSLGAVVRGVLALRPWLGIELALRASAMAGNHEIGGRSARAASYAAGVFACPRYSRKRWFGDLCAGPDLALVHTRGVGFASNRSASRLSAGARIALAVGIAVAPAWSLELRTLGRVAINRPRFTYQTLDGPHHAFSLARFSAGLEFTVGHAF